MIIPPSLPKTCIICKEDKWYPEDFTRLQEETPTEVCLACKVNLAISGPSKHLQREVYNYGCFLLHPKPQQQLNYSYGCFLLHPQQQKIFTYDKPLLHPKYKKPKPVLTEDQKYEKKLKARLAASTKEARYKAYKDGASSRNLPFDLSFEDFCIFWKMPCEYCGSAISTIGLDRIDSSLGYNMDNVMPCCYTCNIMKRNMPLKNFISHIEKIYNTCCTSDQEPDEM